ncbi:MAG: hypothetical protein HXS46_03215 [Theionarchaea archaeon]|nr:hypothetical protein [Theionarchaea archaeon]
MLSANSCCYYYRLPSAGRTRGVGF